jgi:hypothetical protein
VRPPKDTAKDIAKAAATDQAPSAPALPPMPQGAEAPPETMGALPAATP